MPTGLDNRLGHGGGGGGGGRAELQPLGNEIGFMGGGGGGGGGGGAFSELRSLLIPDTGEETTVSLLWLVLLAVEEDALSAIIGEALSSMEKGEETALSSINGETLTSMEKGQEDALSAINGETLSSRESVEGTSNLLPLKLCEEEERKD